MRTNGILFYNHASGPDFGDAEREKLRVRVEEANLSFIQLTPELSVPGLVRQAMSKGAKLFIAAGGDGTVNHVAQALIGTDAALAVIPLGTYNHFAKDAGVPTEWEAALAVALGDTSTKLDVAKVNDRYFLNNISLGLYPDAVRRREEKGRDYPRWRATLYAGFMTLRHWRATTIALEMPADPARIANGESPIHLEAFRTQLLMVSNNAYDLSRFGMHAPRTSLRGGLLSIYWLPKMPRLRFIRFITRYLRGKAEELAGLRAMQTAEVRIHTPHPRTRVGLDGEVVTFQSPLLITIVPGGLRVKV
ncbi:MAG TPA: diacylglycerol kinase family protein [Thermoanaerobaculia bacterium]|nr:diacylglycerol kinase family protein [Thermoanaerobaculia bacterium]